MPTGKNSWWSRMRRRESEPEPILDDARDPNVQPELNVQPETIDRIYGLSVNCTNLERSLEFYKAIGFKEVADISESGGGGLEKGMRLPSPRARGRLLKLGDNAHSINVDLIEWLSPRTEGRAYPRLNHAGIARIALHTGNLQKTYEDLKTKGIEFYSEPQVLQSPRGSRLFACFEDPDGTVLELIQLPPDPSEKK